METPIQLSIAEGKDYPTLETIGTRAGGHLVWFVTGGHPDNICVAKRWPASILRFVDDRPDGRMDLRVFTHSGQFAVSAVPYDEGRADQTWHLPAADDRADPPCVRIDGAVQIDGETIGRIAWPAIEQRIAAELAISLRSAER